MKYTSYVWIYLSDGDCTCFNTESQILHNCSEMVDFNNIGITGGLVMGSLMAESPSPAQTSLSSALG